MNLKEKPEVGQIVVCSASPDATLWRVESVGEYSVELIDIAAEATAMARNLKLKSSTTYWSLCAKPTEEQLNNL